MLENVNLDEAQDLILGLIKPLSGESLSLLEAHGRVVLKDLHAVHDLPSRAQSAVDGYAVAAGRGGRYRVTERLKPGEMPGAPLDSGQACGVVTGGPLPEGTGGVAPSEVTTPEGDYVSIAGDVLPGENIKLQGEDFCAGEMLVQRGDCLNPGMIGVLAAYGKSEVAVFRRPRVAILGLGREVVPFVAEPLPGQLRDSNGPLLAALVLRDGGQVTGVETVGAEDPLHVKRRLEKMLMQNDIVLTTGGTAFGECDQALQIIRLTGARQMFWGVRIKPGSHSGASFWEEKMVISLSGNPAACAAGYHLLVAPALRAMQGLDPSPERIAAVCEDTFVKKGGPRRFVQGQVSCNRDGFRVRILPGQKSSMMKALLKDGNALIDLPAGHLPVEKGDKVQVILLTYSHNGRCSNEKS